MEVKKSILGAKISLLLVFFLGSINSLNADLTINDSLEAVTSGIVSSNYTLTWCSPHASKMDDIFSSGECKAGYIYKDGDVGILSYTGLGFLNSDTAVQVNNNATSVTQVSGIGITNFFEGINTLKFEGEGTYTINITLTDSAFNGSSYSLVYKIDKTAPQFKIESLSEDSPYIYAGDRINGLIGSVKKLDSFYNISDSELGYDLPDINSYYNNQSITTHTRQNLLPIYYKNQTGDEFTLNLNYSDDYDGNLSSYISGVGTGISLLEEDSSLIRDDLVLSNSTNILVDDLNNTDNSQKKYKLRIYDNTVGKNGGEANYSEVIFYAVKDNTKPNMGDSLFSNESDAINNILKFDNTNTVWDQNTSSNVSKFIKANDNHSLYSSINDIGISGSESYEWYNAGLETSELKIQIEENNILDSFEDIFSETNLNRYENNNIIGYKDFSNVDINRENGYRKYKTNFSSQGGLSGICDAVGNCLEPELDFRVVASELSDSNSTISIGKNSYKTFANGNDSYNVQTNIKDIYGNNIIGVKAVENGNKQIKKISNIFNFENGLYSNLTTEIGTGDKLVSINDSQNDNYFSSTINSNGNILFREYVESGEFDSSKGLYSFDISSKVPTKGIYPYLSDNAILRLNSLNTKSENGDINNVGIYDIGNFDYTKNFNGSQQLLTYSTDVFDNSDYFTDIDYSITGEYGEIDINNDSNLSFDSTNYNYEFDFASPIAYGADELTLHHLINNIGQTDSHIKNIYEFDGSSISNGTIFEQFLPSYSDLPEKKYTPNIFNIYSDGNIINSGDTLNFSNVGNTLVKSSPIRTDYYIDGYDFYIGYASYLSYEIGGDQIKIPSISRNLTDPNSPDKESYTYFSNMYEILPDNVISSGLLSSMRIAITGLSNNNDTMINDEISGLKANVNIGEDLTRYDFLTTFKKNVNLNSLGIEWCSGGTQISNLNSDLSGCTIEISGEKISFIEGNVDINCYGTCKLSDNTKRTIIVKDGSTYIKSDINTYGTNAQFLIGTITEEGLSNISIPSGDNPSLTRDSSVYGWTFIDPSITNIDAFVVSQGPLVSYNGSKIFNSPTELELKNQLHIYGSLLSLNTIGGYKSDTDSECPYIVDGICDSKTAFIFDLITLRRYSLEGINDGTGYLYNSGNGIRSGKNMGAIETDGLNPPTIISADTCSPSITGDNLRCITDTDYIVYPLLLEKDPSWVQNSSIMFKVDN